MCTPSGVLTYRVSGINKRSMKTWALFEPVESGS
jgi:hypothetical protein